VKVLREVSSSSVCAKYSSARKLVELGVTFNYCRLKNRNIEMQEPKRRMIDNGWQAPAIMRNVYSAASIMTSTNMMRLSNKAVKPSAEEDRVKKPRPKVNCKEAKLGQSKCADKHAGSGVALTRANVAGGEGGRFTFCFDSCRSLVRSNRSLSR